LNKLARRKRWQQALLPVISFIALSGALCPGRQSEPDKHFALQFDPQHTSIIFTLADVLHTVRGTFRLQQGSLNFDSRTNRLTGEIVVNAKTGDTGNGMRDRKMHREVLESERYSQITFRPDRVDGLVSPQGKSSVKVHGIFSIHGSDHELAVPAQVEMFPDHWTVSLHFSVPYVKWGMKNPSTLFLRVSESVDIDANAAGTISRP
jgi:polyisoprenoid-binding protein YceI